MESIGFSLELSTIYSELLKLVSQRCRSKFGLTYNEFSLLYILVETEQEASADDLATFMMLEKTTVWRILLSLEDKQLIFKRSDNEDSRYMYVTINEKSSVDEILTDVVNSVPDIFRKFLPQEEFNLFMRDRLRQDLDSMRGNTVSGIGALSSSWSNVFPCEYPVFWRVIIEQWQDSIQTHHHLSLSEFRILFLLDEQSLLSSSEISSRLFMAKSLVSMSKRKLLDNKLIEEKKSPFDNRSTIVVATKKGTVLTHKALVHLNEITHNAHSIGSDEAILILKSWHVRMYSNLRRFYESK